MLNVAVTLAAEVAVIVQVPVPEHPPPLQPAKVDPAAGEAVRTTTVPWLYASLQSTPQLIPAGLLVTVPLPLPDFDTVKAYEFRLNVAVTLVAAVTVTVHVPVPVHPPPAQPANVEPAAGVAVSVTMVPLVTLSVQSAPQLMPAGLLVTVPVPNPALATDKVKLLRVNVPVTLLAASMVTTHVPVPLQPPPLQPVKVDPADGVAVSVTMVPAAYDWLQSVPQLMPVGLLVSVPVPVPALVTVSV